MQRVLMILCLAMLATTVGAAPLTVSQLLDIEQVRSCDISPDGRLAAYTVSVNRSLDDDPGGAWSRLWVVATDGQGDPRPFVVGEVSVSSPSFSPDGRYLAFRATRGDGAKAQVWVMPVDGGESVAATASPTGVSFFAWSHDGADVFYVDSSERPSHEKDLKEKKQLPRWYEEELSTRVLRRVGFAWGEEPGEAATLVDDLSVHQISVAGDGGFLAFGASTLNLVDHRYMFQDVYLLDLATGASRMVADTPGKLGAVRLSADGSTVAWTGAASRSDHATSTLFVTDTASGDTRDVTSDDYVGHVRDAAWRDARTLLVQADEGCTTTLATMRADKGWESRKVVYDGETIVAMPATRPGSKTMVMVGHDPTTPRELFAWQGKGEPKRLTTHNPWLADVDLGTQEVVTWTARDGLEIEGILIKPVNWNGEPAPLIVSVHGGPEANVRNGWGTRYASRGQVAAGRGYAVLLPNYRGSTGRGLEFAASSFGDPAGAEFDDIVDGIDFLVDQGIADNARVGVTGGSYGGYATYWLSTYYSDRFAAGVGFVGVSDLVSKRYLTDIPYEDEYVHMGRKVSESLDLMRERSPVTYADRCKTPLLILHGDADPRVHPSQSQEMYRALKMAGHEQVRLVWYPGEGHGNSRRFGREDYLVRTLRWFDYFMKPGGAVDGMPEVDLSGELGLIED